MDTLDDPWNEAESRHSFGGKIEETNDAKFSSWTYPAGIWRRLSEWGDFLDGADPPDSFTNASTPRLKNRKPRFRPVRHTIKEISDCYEMIVKAVVDGKEVLEVAEGRNFFTTLLDAYRKGIPDLKTLEVTDGELTVRTPHRVEARVVFSVRNGEQFVTIERGKDEIRRAIASLHTAINHVLLSTESPTVS